MENKALASLLTKEGLSQIYSIKSKMNFKRGGSASWLMLIVCVT